MRFEIQPMNDSPVEALERGLIDLLLTIDFAISTDHPSQILFEDDYVVIGWDNNPAMTGPMTRELYFELGHVTARFGKSRISRPSRNGSSAARSSSAGLKWWRRPSSRSRP